MVREDAQDVADILLDAEAKLGAMLSAIPDKKASSGAGTRSKARVRWI
jgi:hypothetical protein